MAEIVPYLSLHSASFFPQNLKWTDEKLYSKINHISSVLERSSGTHTYPVTYTEE